jgi:hypothetical protein
MEKKVFFIGMTLALVSCVLMLPANARADIKDGLVSVWPLDEGSGDVAGDAVGSNNGEVLAGYGSGVAPVWTTGKFGGALDFDGVSSFVNCGSDASLQPATVTVSAWIKQASAVGYYAQVAGMATDTGAAESGYSIIGDDEWFGPQGYSMWISGGAEADGSYTATNTNFTLGEWTHIAVTYDGSRAEVYVNGAPGATPHLSEVGDVDYTYTTAFYMGVYWTPLSGYTDWWLPYEGLIDDVAVWNRPLTQDEVSWLYNGGVGNPAPKPLVTPTPSNGAKMVLRDQVLSWVPIAGVTPISYDVYYGSDVNELSPHYDFALVLDDTEETSYDPPGDLDFDTPYYWRVDVTEANDLGPGTITTEGFLFSFTTVPDTPVIDPETPADVLIDAGEDAIFTVDALNPLTGDDTGMTYEWLKVGDPAVLSTTDTLEILSAQVANEGDYYCTVTVTASGKSSDSAIANLSIKRLIGHWPFDRDMTDIVSGNDGTYIGGNRPTYVTGGVIGEAVEFDGSDGKAITVPTIAHISNAYSLVWWENADTDGTDHDWESMLACGDTDGWEVFEFDRYIYATYAFGFNNADYFYSPTATPYPRGVWYLHVVTYDPTEGLAKWYLNGELAGQISTGFDGFDDVIYIGNARSFGQSYIGLIDDLKLFNYPLNGIEVAILYTDVMGGEICGQYPEYDFNADCRVDLLDLTAFLGEWLECNRFPAEFCE